MATSVALAPHIEPFPAVGYKRPLGSISEAPSPLGNYSTANQLAVPNGAMNLESRAIPATTARPDRGVNTCIPVARTCSSHHLTVGQVAFVYRSANVPMKRSSLGGLERIVSMEHLNEQLKAHPLKISNNIQNDMFKPSRAKSVYDVFEKGAATPFQAYVFNTDIITDAFHPYHQYALDGIVCSSADGDEYESDGFKPHSTHRSEPVCNVAVHGPCPLTVVHMPSLHDDFESVRSGIPSKARPAPDVFMEPTRILAEVYVALVASRVRTDATAWTLQYQIVSSSNIDLDTSASPGVHRFRTDTGQLKDVASTATRLVVEVHRLGKVVDCRFGPSNAPQVVVSVNTKKYERTVRTKNDNAGGYIVTPVSVWNSFQRQSARHGTPSAPIAKRRRPFGDMKITPTGGLVQRSEFDDLQRRILELEELQRHARMKEEAKLQNDIRNNLDDDANALLREIEMDRITVNGPHYNPRMDVEDDRQVLEALDNAKARQRFLETYLKREVEVANHDTNKALQAMQNAFDKVSEFERSAADYTDDEEHAYLAAAKGDLSTAAYDALRALAVEKNKANDAVQLAEEEARRVADSAAANGTDQEDVDAANELVETANAYMDQADMRFDQFVRDIIIKSGWPGVGRA